MKKIWEPIVEISDLQEKAFRRIDLIYRELKKSFDSPDLSLYSGKIGTLLFYYYYYLVKNKEDDLWIDLLNQVNDLLYKYKYSNDYYKLCCSNFYSFIILLWENGDITEEELQFLSELDDEFAHFMVDSIQEDNYDLLYGGLNYTSYFLYRYKLNKERIYLDKFLLAIYEKAEKTNEGFRWRSKLVKDPENEILGYNFGLAHGIPSILLMLCYIRKAGYISDLLDHMIRETSKFLLSIEQDFSKFHSHFSSANIDRNTMSRLGWCYGDLGVGYSLLIASQELDDKGIDLRKRSLTILKDTTDRITEESTLIRDHCICHGSTGVGHIYNRLYQITEDELYKKASFYWFKSAIDAPLISGFPAGYMEYEGNNNYTSGYSLLSGISGIGLALISAISPVVPKWDRVLLLS